MGEEDHDDLQMIAVQTTYGVTQGSMEKIVAVVYDIVHARPIFDERLAMVYICC